MTQEFNQLEPGSAKKEKYDRFDLGEGITMEVEKVFGQQRCVCGTMLPLPSDLKHSLCKRQVHVCKVCMSHYLTCTPYHPERGEGWVLVKLGKTLRSRLGNAVKGVTDKFRGDKKPEE